MTPWKGIRHVARASRTLNGHAHVPSDHATLQRSWLAEKRALIHFFGKGKHQMHAPVTLCTT